MMWSRPAITTISLTYKQSVNLQEIIATHSKEELQHLLKDFEQKLLDEQMHFLSSLSAENQVI